MMLGKDRHLVVLSEDALVFEDLEYLSKLPTYSSLWDGMAHIDRMYSVYPTVTYPVHTTMRTGVYCGEHGVTGNEYDMPGLLDPPWNFDNNTVKVPDIFDAAKSAGLTTAAVFWPVTGNHRSIDYLVDECWPPKDSGAKVSADCFREWGSSEEVIRKIIEPSLPLFDYYTNPYWSDFMTRCACAIIREFRPNLLMLHPTTLDGYRHRGGVFSPLVTHGLHLLDVRLSDLVKALKDADIFERTDFFIVSDHGQMNVTRIVCLNVILKEKGFIRVNEDGSLRDYDAFCKTVGMAAYIFLSHPEDAALKAAVESLLNELCREGVYGISRVYTAEEALLEEGLSGEFSFVLETDGYTAFGNDWNGSLIRNYDIEDYRYGLATHGYHPAKGPQPTLMAFGPDIKAGAHLSDGSIIDEAATFARVLGIPLPHSKGTAITEILR